LNGFGQCPTAGVTIDEVNPSSVVVDTDFSRESRKLFVVGYYTRASMWFAGGQLSGVGSQNNSAGNMFLLQYSDSGLDWMRPIGRAESSSTAARVKALDDGVIVGVKFIDTVDVGGVHVSSGYENALLLRMDAEGNILWARHLDSDGFSKVSAIDTDEFGNIYTYGHYQDNLRIGSHSIQAQGNVQETQTELFLSKFSPEGDLLWLRHFAGGTGWDDAEKLICKDGRLYLSGFFAGELNIGQTSLTSSSNANGFLCLADTSGSPIWIRQLISSSVRELAMACTDDGIMLAGIFQEQMSIGSDVLDANGWLSGFVLSVDSLGSVAWMKNIGGSQSDGINRIGKVSSDFYVLSGSGSSQFSVDGHELINQSTVGQWNAFTLLMDSEGTVNCIYPISSTDESQVWVSHISADTVWQVGLYQSDATVGDTTFYCPMPCGASFFIAKTCMNCPELIRLSAGEIPPNNRPFLSVYPNPATHTVHLKVSDSRFPAQSVAVTDMLGNTVMNLNSETLNLELDVSGLANGVYTVAVTLSSGEMLRQRLVVGR
jgi:hypothetical protein